MRFWLGVVSRDHVLRGVALGIAQIGHGRRSGLQRLKADDWLVYYSPRPSLGSKQALRAFTAIGQVADNDIWQADEGDFHPWRRRITYLDDVTEIPIAMLADELELTSTPNWGYQLRRGLLELSEADFKVIRGAMSTTTA